MTGHTQAHDRHEIEVGDEHLNFTRHAIDDPEPLGRQIIRTMGVHPVDDYVTLALLPDGVMEDIGLDVTFDIRGRANTKFIVLQADALFRFVLDGNERLWKGTIPGRTLKLLAGVDASRYDLYQEVKGHDDLLIRDTDHVDLTKKGVEKFYTAVAQTTEGLSALLPPRDKAYLDESGILYEDLIDGGHRGIVLRDFPLPEGKFDAAKADFLLLLPPGYPDCPIDMWYTRPWLKLASTGIEAKQTQIALQVGGVTWQRWSRHNYEWRRGVDGIHTMVARIQRALAEAA